MKAQASVDSDLVSVVPDKKSEKKRRRQNMQVRTVLLELRWRPIFPKCLMTSRAPWRQLGLKQAFSFEAVRG